MHERPLRLPLLVGADHHQDAPDLSSIRPTHMAVWDKPPSPGSGSGSSRPGRTQRVALAGRDNSIWVYSLPAYNGRSDVSAGHDGPSRTPEDASGESPVPEITFSSSVPPPPTGTHGDDPDASASSLPASPNTALVPGTTNGLAGPSKRSRPPQLRATSFTHAHAHATTHRSRAASTASSILSSSSKRRASALSPKSPSSALPAAVLSSATAQADPHEGHDHVRAETERAELLDHLRGQCSPTGPDDRGGPGLGLGLGIGVVGRRGLSGVHSHEEIAERDRERNGSAASGATSPTRSEASTSIAGRLKGWRRDEEGERERERRALMEMVTEVEVERAMAQEEESDRREAEDGETVREARSRSRGSLGTSTAGTPVLEGERAAVGPEEMGKGAVRAKGEGEGADGRQESRLVMRIILPQAWRGKVKDMRVVEACLLVLRDTGALDIISLLTFRCISSLNLEEPEPLRGNLHASSAPASKSSMRLTPFWQWRRLHIIRHGEDTLVIAHGLPWACGLPSPNGEVTRVIITRLGVGALDDSRLEVLAKLELAGEGDIGVCTLPTGSYILHSTSTALTSYPVTSPPRLRSTVTTAPRTGTGVAPNRAVSSAHAPSSSADPHNELRKTRSVVALRDAADLPPPPPLPGATKDKDKDKDRDKDKESKFSRLMPSAHRRADREREKEGRHVEFEPSWGVGEAREVHREGKVGLWEGMWMGNGGWGVAAQGDEVHVFEFDGRTLENQGQIALRGKSLTGAMFGGNEGRVCLQTEATRLIEQTSFATFHRSKAADAATTQWEPLDGWTESYCSTTNSLGYPIIAGPTGIFAPFMSEADIGGQDHPLLRCRGEGSETAGRAPTAVCPYDMDYVFTSDPAGNVSKAPLTDMLSGRDHSGCQADIGSDRLDAFVSCMKVVHAGEMGRYLVAGDTDGAIRIWRASTFELQGSWTLFAFPVHSIVFLDQPQAGVLRGSILCTSQAGTVGFISLIEMDQTFLIPASRVPLRRVFLGGKDIMLAYANGKARVWNVETKEFRRSTGLDAAEDMLANGDWVELELGVQSDYTPPLRAVTPAPDIDSDLGRLLELDLRALATFLADSRSTMSTSPLATLRMLLTAVLTFGIDHAIDRICEDELQIVRPRWEISCGLEADSGSISIKAAPRHAAWTMSKEMTGLRQLVIVSLFRPFLDSPDHERWAAQVIAYYTASLPPDIVDADLAFFAVYYLDSASDVQSAARMLFDCRMDRMSEAEIEAVVDEHISELPSFLPKSDQHTEAADTALTMLGAMALHKYQSIPPAALKAIADSVYLYLHSKDSTHTALAIELASKGFATWQTFIDPAEMLRRLFFLSTNTPTPNSLSTAIPSIGSGSQISAQARLAVLHVASSNPALFMSTLSMDILDARSAEGRKSIMKLCVYMARKRPQVLENSLPRIVEAVVKSLDPNVGKMREDVQQTATVILNELVLAFSTVDFHSGTQRLAVGTHEGALIMYDLKSACRLYVLDPHKHPVSAVTFSPDGRRLITVSVEEGNLTVWKIGSSLSGFFAVGGPPRQGGGGKGEPFKRIEFARADDVPLKSTSALSDVQISWPGSRQAKVVIKETALTFET